MVKVTAKKTYTFDEKALRDILTQYVAENYAVDVQPDQFKISVREASWGGYREDFRVPAGLNSISIEVEDEV